MTSLLDKENDPGKDLALLSSCDHLILSYGTYGMAAAWFNNNGLLFVFFNSYNGSQKAQTTESCKVRRNGKCKPRSNSNLLGTKETWIFWNNV